MSTLTKMIAALQQLAQDDENGEQFVTRGQANYILAQLDIELIDYDEYNGERLDQFNLDELLAYLGA